MKPSRAMQILVSVLVLCAGTLAGFAQDTDATAAPEVQSSPPQVTVDAAQSGASTPRAPIPVLVFDRTRALNQSQAGIALKAELDAARDALIAENDAIYQKLEAEERAISEQRDAMSDDDFRAAAQAFDEKVTQVRDAQDEKSREVQALYDTNLQELEAQMNTALAQTARQTGAVIVFERGQVYMMSGAIDVTEELIKRLDQASAAAEDAAESGETPQIGDADTPPEADN